MLRVCYQALLIEFVTGDPVQHHVAWENDYIIKKTRTNELKLTEHPDIGKEGDGLEKLIPTVCHVVQCSVRGCKQRRE